MHGFDRPRAVWPRTLWKIPSESACTSWIIGERQKWCTVGIISGKSSKNRSLGAPGQIYCPDNHLSFRRESLAGVPGPDPRSQVPGPRSQVPGPDPRSSTPQTRSYDHGLFRTLHSGTIAGFLFVSLNSVDSMQLNRSIPIFNIQCPEYSVPDAICATNTHFLTGKTLAEKPRFQSLPYTIKTIKTKD